MILVTLVFSMTTERCLQVLSPSRPKTLILTLLPPAFPVSSVHNCDNHTEFSCKTNYRCIPQWAVCNGVDDCRDNSDEQGCGRWGYRGVGKEQENPSAKKWVYISYVIFLCSMLYFYSILQGCGLGRKFFCIIINKISSPKDITIGKDIIKGLGICVIYLICRDRIDPWQISVACPILQIEWNSASSQNMFCL